jgi:hypothetical protein
MSSHKHMIIFFPVIELASMRKAKEMAHGSNVQFFPSCSVIDFTLTLLMFSVEYCTYSYTIFVHVTCITSSHNCN